MIQATVEDESGSLQELVRAGADLNLQNEVREFSCEHCRCSSTVHHPLLSVLGGSDSSDDLGE